MRKKIGLPAPKVLPGQRVNAHNYRSKQKDGTWVWEAGRCTFARLGISSSSDGKTLYKRWAYGVILDRRSRSNIKYGREYGNSSLRLTVNDDAIAPLIT